MTSLSVIIGLIVLDEVTMNNKPKTKLLTISLLCCGRPDTTERCLKSLMPIREAIDSELQIVDTGCQPETRALIEKYADEIFEFQWVNDFSAARNFQLDQANGKMFLFIDDDEWFLDPKPVIDFFKEPNCTTYNIGGYFQRNYFDFDGKEYQDIEVIRMCSVTPETRFLGKVHEYILPADGNTMFMEAYAGHFGYVYVSDEDNLKHAQRNIPLIKEMMEEDPDNLRWPYQLAQEVKAIHDYQYLYDICKESYERTKEKENNENLRYRGSFFGGMGLALNEMKKYQEVIALYEKEASNPTVMEMPLARVAFYAAVAYMTLGDDAKCIEACEYYLKIYEKIGNDKMQTYLQGGLFSYDTFDHIKLNLAYCYIMTAGINRNDYSYLTRFYRKINWQGNVVRLSRSFLTTLVDFSAKNGYKKEFRDVLNRFFIKEGFCKALEDTIDEYCPHYDLDNLNNLKAAFKTTEGEKEMGLFMDVRILEKQISLVKDWDNFKQLTDVLEAYSALTMKWQRAHDTKFPVEGGLPILAPETRLGCDIVDFLEYSKNEPTKALKVLKDMFGVRPALTNALTELANLYGQIQKVEAAKAENPEKFQEMYNLEEQVLQQIAQLDEAGKTEEAVATYQQLVGVIQNTYGVDSLHV
jgi:glycosyltransferase involved in cell wall biosynthesis